MPNYKLTYFNFRGRAEIIRYLFAYTNTKYEDVRLDYEKDWPAQKDSLTGKTDLDDLHIDAILDTIDDFILQFPWTADEKTIKEYIAKPGASLCSNLEKELGDKKWFAGDYVTWADFFWEVCSDSFEYYQSGFCKDYPNLFALKQRVRELPAIAAWIKRRPETPY
ncbi:hypothetical protein GDO78_019919 [Eleutherodactylus coqui]|uniref:glutathione transferase n=1 Tax=Eleutherodactylus coqui TaxID=57060 RepID=A0A8J6JZI0_ELECQ|nr:hypothetical protein GDO78_019919 [Eleutherodactylus coqui]